VQQPLRQKGHGDFGEAGVAGPGGTFAGQQLEILREFGQRIRETEVALAGMMQESADLRFVRSVPGNSSIIALFPSRFRLP